MQRTIEDPSKEFAKNAKEAYRAKARELGSELHLQASEHPGTHQIACSEGAVQEIEAFIQEIEGASS